MMKRPLIYLIVAIALFLALISATGMVWYELNRENTVSIRETARTTTNYLIDNVRQRVESQNRALIRTARRMEKARAWERSDWLRDVTMLQEHMEGMAAVTLVGANYKPMWVVPDEQQDPLTQRVENNWRQWQIELETTRIRAESTAWPAYSGTGGEDDLFIGVPLNPAEGSPRFLVAKLDLDTVLQLTARDAEQLGFYVEIKDRGRSIYRPFPRKLDRESPYTFLLEEPFYGKTWDVWIQPSKAYLKTKTSAFPLIVLICGGVLALTLPPVVYSAGVTRDKTRRLSELNNRLHDEVEHRKSAESQLIEAKEKADAANQAKSEFLANMSHEIRTPLGAIIGFCELASSEKTAPEQRREFLDKIQRNSHQLLALINDILDLSKVEAGRMDLTIEDVRLRDLVSDVFGMFEVQASQKSLDLRHYIDDNVPDILGTDPARLRQVLVNLVGNALKFTAQGTVTLYVSAKFTEGRSRPDIFFDVVDTGPGMTRSEATQIFDPFNQLQRAASRPHGGTGLGLALSKNLAQRLGGDLWLHETRVGEGSTFRFSIRPTKVRSATREDDRAAKHADAQLDEAEAQPLEGKKLLLVEDSPDNQLLFRFLLESAGAKIETAKDGNEGVKRALGEPFDLVLMDIQMPGMDGYEAAQKIRSAGASVPMIALTANAMKEEESRCLRAGFSAYVAKPVDGKTLTRVIHGQLA